MTEFYLVTGFLGAGKTTFLSDFLPRFKGKTLKIIINEFGNSGVDGSLLKSIDAQLDEICGGSIFCSCKLDKFENAMESCLKTAPDIIVVEASGLSDPTNIKKILNSYEEKGKLVYKGSICLVDAVRFHKVFATARVCKKQLAVSDVVIINKVDLVTPEQAQNLSQSIKDNFPYANIHFSEFGKTDFDFDKLIHHEKVEFDESSYRPDITTQKASIQVKSEMSKYELERFINLFAEDTARIKGYVYLNECGMLLIDCVGAMISIKSTDKLDVAQGINIMATGGQPLRKSLKSAVSFYLDKVDIKFG